MYTDHITKAKLYQDQPVPDQGYWQHQVSGVTLNFKKRKLYVHKDLWCLPL